MKSTKISMIRAALLASIAVSGLAVTAPVMAQDEAASAESGDEIIVTARRREENLLDVPIAVSALVSPGPVMTKATPGLPDARA